MSGYLKRFWAWLVSLAAITGLYVAAVAAKLTKYFWIVVIIAAVLAIGKPAQRVLREAFRRIRTYNALLRRAGNAEARVQQLEAEIEGFPPRLDSAKRAGFMEAWAQVIGGALSGKVEPPRMVGIKEIQGSLVLVARFENNSRPHPKTWFTIQSPTGVVKGTVEVVEVDDIRNSVLMRPVGSLDNPFWKHLAERVSYDDSPPRNAFLATFQVDYEQAITEMDSYTSTDVSASNSHEEALNG